MSRTALNAQLQWGPCPEFMPKGCGITGATCTSKDPCVLFIAFEGPVDAHRVAAASK